MYTPAAFAVDEAFVAEFLPTIVAADIITMTEQGLLATFLPVMYDGANFVSHMARNNKQWKLEPQGDALLIAHGPNAYISPSWYSATQEHGRVVPTYNYSTAHIYGELRVHQEAAWIDSAVRALTLRHEAHRSEPWSVEDPPAGYIDGQLRAIVGLEFVVRRVAFKHKMSQNRPAAEVEGIVAGLLQDGEASTAARVRDARR